MKTERLRMVKSQSAAVKMEYLRMFGWRLVTKKMISWLLLMKLGWEMGPHMRTDRRRLKSLEVV